MPRYRLTIAYDGTRFHGWQKQFATPAQLADTNFSGLLLTDREAPGAGSDRDERAELRTVQGVVERRLQRVCREPVSLLGSSRTDSGVHALAQVAAFSRTNAGVGPADDRLVDAINAGLPEDVVVTEAARVPDDFDPIRACVRKGYVYTVCGGARPLWRRRYATHIRQTLELEPMREAAGHLVGTHDFAAFTNVGAERESTVRTIHSCDVSAEDGLIRISVCGDGFLYNMVRIIAGTLTEVGRGRVPPERAREALATGDRRLAGPTLPPEGLRLEWMEHEIGSERGSEIVRSPGPGALRLR